MHVVLVNRAGDLARAILTSEEWYLQMLRTAVGREFMSFRAIDDVFHGAALLGVLGEHLTRRGRAWTRACA